MKRERKPKRKKRQWPNVYARTHCSGETGYIVDLGLINGNRERHSFASKTEADTFAETKRVERQNEGTAALALSTDTRRDAAKAVGILSPYGFSLQQAAEYYAQHVLAYRDTPQVPEIAKRLIEDAGMNDRRERTIEELQFRLTTFASDFEGRRLSEITVEEIEDWINVGQICGNNCIHR